MTEAEVLELIAIYIENAMTGFSIFITVTFAYMTVAYIVGSKMSPFQVWAASGLYLFAALCALLCVYLQVHTWSALRSGFPGGILALDSAALYNGSFWKIFLTTTQLLGIAISFYFMYNVRNSGESEDASLPT